MTIFEISNSAHWTSLTSGSEERQGQAEGSVLASQRSLVFARAISPSVPRATFSCMGRVAKIARSPCGPGPRGVLRDWFRELGQPEQACAFPTIRGEPLTRFAIHLLLRKAVDRASSRCAILKKRVSPHFVSHSTAMALLQSGVDIAVIALWLGHESIETTNVYLHANLAMKKRRSQRSLRSAPGSGDSARKIACRRSSNRSDRLHAGANEESPGFNLMPSVEMRCFFHQLGNVFVPSGGRG